LSPLILLSLSLVSLAPLAGRVAGSLASRRRWIEPGQARRVMPGLPQEKTPALSQLGKRFDFRVEVASTQIRQRMLASGVKGVTAQALAAQLSLPQEICAAALERLRAQATCHLRVTRSGTLLHDFEESSLRLIKRDTRVPWIARLTLFIASTLANLGAAWPLFLSLLGASLALLGIFGEHTTDNSFFVAIAVIFMVPLSFALVIAGGVLVGGMLTPLSSSPHLGNAIPALKEEGEAKITRKRAKRTDDGGAAWHKKITESDAFGASDIAKTVVSSIFYVDLPIIGLGIICKVLGLPFSYFFIGLGLLLLLIPLIYLMGSSFELEVVPFVIIGLLIAVAIVAFVGIIFWLIGLWRSVTQTAPSPLSPGENIQRPVAPDELSVLVPTNDLVFGSYAALQRAFSNERPIDPNLSGRLRAEATTRGGRLAALEITLREGVSPEEAVAIGASLASHSGGSIEVSEDGELFFVLPDAPLEEVGVAAECFVKTAAHRFEVPVGIPVNLPGVTLATIEGMERLCAGTFLMFLTMWASAEGAWQRLFGPDAWVARGWMVPVSAWLLVGAFALTGTLRYLARAEARAGFFRDVRRETLSALRSLLVKKAEIFQAKEFAGLLTKASKKLWPSLTVDQTLKEVEAACDDLGLELSPDALANNKEETRPYALDSLQTRLATLKAPVSQPASTDQVIFDSATLTRPAAKP
jgi:hypothetical protein